jgi:hypothetical protein
MPGKNTSMTDVLIDDIEVFSPRKGKSSGYLGVTLQDGRIFAVPLDLYPTLQNASESMRKNWRLVGKGQGVHWPALDLDLSAEGLLAGRPDATKRARVKFSPEGAALRVLKEMYKTSHPMTTTQIANLLSASMPQSTLRLIIKHWQKKVANQTPTKLPANRASARAS